MGTGQGSGASLRLRASLRERTRFKLCILATSAFRESFAFCPRAPGLTFQVLPSKAGSGARNTAVSRGSCCAFETPGCLHQKQTHTNKTAISDVSGSLGNYLIVTGFQMMKSVWNELWIMVKYI